MNSSDIERAYKLSPMQQGMLFHHQLEPRSGVDIEQMVCSLHEDLDVAAFQKAWERVLSRHESLRTGFQWEGIEEPLQQVHSRAALHVGLQDWRTLPADEQEKEFAEYLRLDRKRGFDLTKAPLMRLSLLRLGAADYRVLWTFHHIVADGRSHPVILNEVFAFYEAFRAGRELELKQPGQYGEYIEWLGKQDHAKAETFWRQLLKGFAAPTPVDAIPRTGRRGDFDENTGEQEIEISADVTSSLRTVAEKYQLTLNTLVQGSWALLLSRYSGEQDVVFGAVRACRRDTVGDAESVAGLFINTLPLRVHVPPDRNLASWLRDLREQNQAIRAHEHTPLVQVLGWSDVRHGTPLFESIIIFDNYELNARLRKQGKGWSRREFRLIEKTGFPLALYGYADRGLLLKIAYDKRRFDYAVTGQMLGNLKTLLEGMAGNLDRPLGALPILTEREEELVLREWNDTTRDYPREKCIHHLIEEQVERAPDAVALVFEDRLLTYRQLNGRANQLARHLRKMGVGPETRVGIYMERSLDMMVGLLGVLKAGGAYLPLDHAYPAERIAFMLEDARVPVLLTQSRLVKDLPGHQARVVCLDSDWGVISEESGDNVQSGVAPRNMSYLIYTSGSTGKPKGVMVCHGNVVNFFAGMDERIPRHPAGVWLAVTSISFDIHVLELFWTLARGFKIVLYADKTRDLDPSRRQGSEAKDGDELYTIPAQLRRHKVTHFQCTPSLAGILLADDETRASLKSVKTFTVGGEALPPALASELKQAVSGRLINMYGPTETTVWSTTCLVNGGRGASPIGRPIANTEIYILDQNLMPVPAGVAGELFIGGAGVTRGYLNRPELNAERFIQHPFSDEAGARLYRTGDLARYRPDGNIEYLGRIDNQVKIRGFRIELGEIETRLEEHPHVHQAVVAAREDVPGDKRLAAYIVPKKGQTPSISGLRESLREKLPEYMAPETFMILEKLPLTPNGKIDRRSLPSPTGLRPELEAAFVAPRTEIEQTITALWQGALHLEKIGVNDNFFDLGGNSLRMAQVHARLREKLQRNLSMLELFRYPTISSLARHLSAGEDEQVPKTDERVEKLKEGKNRLQQRFRQREQHNVRLMKAGEAV